MQLKAFKAINEKLGLTNMINNRLRLQRNILILSSGVLLASNIILAVTLQTQEKLVVLTPTIDKEITIGTNYVSEDYLQLRAEQIATLLFNIRQENYLYNQTQLLAQIAPEASQEFKDQLEQFVADVKQKKYYYVFHKHGFEIDNKELTVTIAGELETYLTGKLISSMYKKFRFTFTNSGSIVMLTSFEEVTDENAN